MSLPLSSHVSAPHGMRRAAWILSAGLGVAGGVLLAYIPLLGLLAVAAAGLALAIPFVEGISVLAFWLLPYLILNLPTGGVTLKVPEVTAYGFTLAALLRAGLRREPVAVPPATLQVLIYLAVLAASSAAAPVVPDAFSTFFTGLQGVDARSGAMLFWLGLSWLVVMALYHVVGTRPDLFRRCVRGHILGSGLASLIGILGYIAALRGNGLFLNAIGNSHTFIYTGGSVYRLTGVSYEPLLFAFYLVTTIPVTLVVLLLRPGWVGRIWAGGSLILQVLALLMTFSPGGWAALAGALLVVGVLLRPRIVSPKKWGIALLATVLLIGVSAGAVIVSPVVSRSLGFAFNKIVQGGYTMRDNENATGMNIFYAHPLLGVGPGMAPFYFPSYHPVARSFAVQGGIYINNQYIDTLAETGVLGFLALTGCAGAGLAALVVALLKRRPQNAPVLVALTASLMGIAVQYWETHNLFLIYFTMLVGLALAGARLANSGAKEV